MVIVAAIMAAFIHVEYVEDISYHDLSSWCNRYSDAIGKLMQQVLHKVRASGI